MPSEPESESSHSEDYDFAQSHDYPPELPLTPIKPPIQTPVKPLDGNVQSPYHSSGPFITPVKAGPQSRITQLVSGSIQSVTPATVYTPSSSMTPSIQKRTTNQSPQPVTKRLDFQSRYTPPWSTGSGSGTLLLTECLSTQPLESATGTVPLSDYSSTQSLGSARFEHSPTQSLSSGLFEYSPIPGNFPLSSSNLRGSYPSNISPGSIQPKTPPGGISQIDKVDSPTSSISLESLSPVLTASGWVAYSPGQKRCINPPPL
jgi:hypothetical protein